MSRRKNKSSLGVLIIFSAIIVGIIYLYNSVMFERDKPTITLDTNGYWNLKKPLEVRIDDTSGIKSYKIIYKTKDIEEVIYNEKLLEPKKSVTIEVSPPRSAYAIKDKNVEIRIEATDSSKWNFLSGNRIKKEFKFSIDKKKPQLTKV